jgi:hypothetical protein
LRSEKRKEKEKESLLENAPSQPELFNHFYLFIDAPPNNARQLI